MQPDPNAFSICGICDTVLAGVGVQVLPCWLDCVLVVAILAAWILLGGRNQPKSYRVNRGRSQWRRSRTTRHEMWEDASFWASVIDLIQPLFDRDQ